MAGPAHITMDIWENMGLIQKYISSEASAEACPDGARTAADDQKVLESRVGMLSVHHVSRLLLVMDPANWNTAHAHQHSAGIICTSDMQTDQVTWLQVTWSGYNSHTSSLS